MNEIDGALKNFKQFEINEEKAKIAEYKLAYEIIHENYPITVVKNVASKTTRILLILVTVLFFALTIFAFVPNGIQNFFKDIDAEQLPNLLSVLLGFSFLLITIFAYCLRISMKKNHQRRNVIYELSCLLEEVVEHAEYSVDDKTRRYEMYVENLHRNQK